MEYNKKMINRIHRIQGQLNGVIKMMEEEKNCKDVISQLSASKSSIQRLMGIIISENLVECVKMSEENSEDSQALINEAVELLINDNGDFHDNHVTHWNIWRIYFRIGWYRGSNYHLSYAFIITTFGWSTHL